MPSVPRIAVQRLHPDAQLPCFAHTGDFGDLAADLHSVSACTLEPGETAAIPTGLAFGFPSGFGGLIHDRSSVALRGLHTLAGVIDPGYRGEVKIILTNLRAFPQTLAAGGRIAQLRIVARQDATFIASDNLDETLRHTGGFGSTGV